MKIIAGMLATALLVTTSVNANEPPLVRPMSPENYQLDESNQRLAQTYERMFRYYAKRNFSHTRTVRVLLSNYPQHVEAIMYTAFDRYPSSYKHLIRAAIDAEPAFTRDIITMALNMGVADPADIVRAAVEAEPSYADDIVATVSEQNNAHLENLIRVAVRAEPEMAQSILTKVSNEQPGQLELIVQTILEAAPALGNYIATLVGDLVGEEDSESSLAETTSRRERIEQTLRGAHRAGISYDRLQAVAKNYGISDQELTRLIN